MDAFEAHLCRLWFKNKICKDQRLTYLEFAGSIHRREYRGPQGMRICLQ